MKLLGTFLCLSLIHLCHCAGDGNGKGATNAPQGGGNRPPQSSATSQHPSGQSKNLQGTKNGTTTPPPTPQPNGHSTPSPTAHSKDSKVGHVPVTSTSTVEDGHNGPHEAPLEHPVEPPADPSSGETPEHSGDPSSDAPAAPTDPEAKPEEKDVKLDVADLAKVDFKAFTLSESKVGGILVRKTFSTNVHHHLKEVVDGPATLWESDKDEAKSVVVHYDGGAPALLLLKWSDTNHKHFSKNGGKWNEVTGEEHKELVDKLNAKHAPKNDE